MASTDILVKGLGGVEVSDADELKKTKILHKGILTTVNIHPSHDIYTNAHRYVRQVGCDPGFATALNGNELVYTTLIKKGSFAQVEHMFLRIQLTSATAVVRLLPVPYWFTQIELLGTASGEVIQRWYPESLMLALQTFPSEVMDQWGPMLAISKGFSDNPNEEMGVGLAGVETRDFILPMFGMFPELSSTGFNFNALYQDMMLRLTWASTAISNNVSATAGAVGTVPWIAPPSGNAAAGTVTVTALELWAAEKQDVRKELLLTSQAMAVRWQEPINMTQNITLAPGAQTTVDLARLNGMSVTGLLVGVRRQLATARDCELNKFWDLGRGATISVIDSGGNNILSAAPINNLFLQRILGGADCPSALLDTCNWTMVSCASDWTDDLKGINTGVWPCDSTNYRLAIVPGALPGIAQVQTITTNVGAGGSYTLGYTSLLSGSYSETQPIVSAETVLNMKTFFEALPSVREDRVSVIFSAVASAGASFNAVLWGPGHFKNYNLINFRGFVAAGTVATGTTTIATAPVRGIAAAVAAIPYSLMLMAFVDSRVTYANGQWEAKRVGLSD